MPEQILFKWRIEQLSETYPNERSHLLVVHAGSIPIETRALVVRQHQMRHRLVHVLRPKNIFPSKQGLEAITCISYEQTQHIYITYMRTLISMSIRGSVYII